MEKGGTLKMMSDEALSAFRRNVMDQTELVWHTRETVLTLIDEIIRLRKELDKLMWSTNAPAEPRKKCTKNNPYTVDKNNPLSRWVHVDANEVHDSQESHQHGGDTVRLRCPHCGIEWTEELPQ